MPERFNFSFTPNKSDYIKTYRAFALEQTATKIAIGLSTLIILVILASIYFLHDLSLASFTVLLVMAVYYLAILFIVPANIADKVTKDEKQSSEINWMVDEHEVCASNKFSAIDCDWSEFGQVYETNEHFLLTYASNKNMFQPIPKRVFKTKDQLDQFRNLLGLKTKPVKRISAVNLPELSRNISMVLLYVIVVIFIIIVVAYGYSHGIKRL